MGWLKKFGLTQNILGLVKGQGKDIQMRLSSIEHCACTKDRQEQKNEEVFCSNIPQRISK